MATPHSEPESEAQQPTIPRLSLRRLARLCRKELRETLRDRRTIITLVLMPLLAYPLLTMIFQNLLVSSVQSSEDVHVWIAVESQEARGELMRYLSLGDDLLRPQERSGEAALGGQGQGSVEAVPDVQIRVQPNMRELVAEARVDVGVRVMDAPRESLPKFGQPLRCQLVVRQGSQLSETGARFVQRRLEAVNDVYVRRQLEELQVGPTLPTGVVRDEIKPASSAVSLTAFVPLILILMTITGAVYPAIDLTAGERERGTLETLMAAPVPRLGLLIAKYVAVVTVAMLTATANLVAMSVTLLATGLGPMVFGESGLTWVLVDQVFILLMLFALFFSAILLAVTSFARSFKEAQAYLIPLMLITLAPGVISLMPDLEFSGTLAVTPLINIVLLARDLLEGGVDLTLASVAVLSTLLYAVAAIAVASRVFGADAILYGSQSTWSDMLRRPRRPSDTVTVAHAMLFLAVLFPTYFLLANALQQFAGGSMSVRLTMSALVTALLFGVLPLAAAAVERVRIFAAFQLHRPALLAVAGAALLGVSLWPFAHEIFLLNRMLGFNTLRQEHFESARRLLEGWRDVPIGLILVTLAVIPAVFEELFFRGYLLSALRRSLPRGSAIVISAILFGLFHVVATSGLATERFLPSTFLGLVLGWICLRSGSLLPAVLAHMLHNGLLLMIAHFRDDLVAEGWGVQQQQHLPLLWLLAAAVSVILGASLVHVSSARGGSARVQKTTTQAQIQ